MAKLYVFGIGGTGSRVIKSLAMLLASGCSLHNNFKTVVPIIIDPDTANGDLNRTKEILRLYQEIRNQVNAPKDFFKQEIKTVNELANNSSVVNSDHFQFNLTNVNQSTFGDYIGYNGLSNEHINSSDDKSFTRLLYSEKNLNANLSVGFKGNPNMGAIVLNQFTDSEDYKRFSQTFEDGDAIFIVSSIFGGTGAAGFPLLLKNLRDGENQNISNRAKIKEAPIGAITYLPYFALNKKDEINSDSFEDKAKIAIDYYNRTIVKQKKVNSLYLIGDKGNKKHLDYAVGGKEQKNNAHFLEMSGALAILDFCEHSNEYNSETIIKEFGIENNDDTITFGDLNLKNQKEITKPITKYKLFAEYLNIGLKKALSSSRWTKYNIALVSKNQKSYLNKKYFTSSEYKLQIKTFNQHFLEWLKEMEENVPSFSPFNVTNWEDALNLIKGKTLEKGSKSFKPIDQENNKLITKIEFKSSSETKHNTLVKVFEQSIENVLNKSNLLKEEQDG